MLRKMLMVGLLKFSDEMVGCGCDILVSKDSLKRSWNNPFEGIVLSS
jgi:hypothetical protein